MSKLTVFICLISVITSAQKIDSCRTDIKHNFKLLTEEGLKIDTIIAKISGVYISKDSFLDLDKKWKDRFSCIRFFENGKVYKSCSYRSFPTKQDFEDLSYGTYSEYKVQNGRIVIESYAGWTGFFLEYYTIQKNTIIRIGTSKRKFNKNLQIEPSPTTTSYEFYHLGL